MHVPDITFHCQSCHSTNVSRDAWADWDRASQQWVLRCAFDYAYCHDCDGETQLVGSEIELQQAPD